MAHRTGKSAARQLARRRVLKEAVNFGLFVSLNSDSQISGSCRRSRTSLRRGLRSGPKTAASMQKMGYPPERVFADGVLALYNIHCFLDEIKYGQRLGFPSAFDAQRRPARAAHGRTAREGSCAHRLALLRLGDRPTHAQTPGHALLYRAHRRQGCASLGICGRHHGQGLPPAPLFRTPDACAGAASSSWARCPCKRCQDRQTYPGAEGSSASKRSLIEAPGHSHRASRPYAPTTFVNVTYVTPHASGC
jgi:hypothetical protein